MKTQVEFRSEKFPPYDGEEEQINPGLWGKRLAEYLQENLPQRADNASTWLSLKHGIRTARLIRRLPGAA